MCILHINIIHYILSLIVYKYMPFARLYSTTLVLLFVSDMSTYKAVKHFYNIDNVKCNNI